MNAEPAAAHNVTVTNQRAGTSRSAVATVLHNNSHRVLCVTNPYSSGNIGVDYKMSGNRQVRFTAPPGFEGCTTVASTIQSFRLCVGGGDCSIWVNV